MGLTDSNTVTARETTLKTDTFGLPYETRLMYVCRDCKTEYSEEGRQRLMDNYLGGCAKCGCMRLRAVVL